MMLPRQLSAFQRTGFCFATVTALALSTGAAETDESEEVVELSPFTVESSEEDSGYAATNTLAGTRLNSRLDDVAGSITVVTARQLEDTGALDLNDVFQYEANTEGSRQYTDYTVGIYGNVRDDTQIAPEGANRIRGIDNVATSRNFFPSNPHIPFDSYNVERLTINRGPNAVLFGMGNAAGVVNMSPQQALLNASSNSVQFRFGSNNDKRAAINLNQTIVEDTLAIRFAALYSDRGFSRQPAHDEQHREYAAITYKPFSKTTIRANLENYARDARRPNTITPIDFSAHWRENGRPMWNPLNGTIHWEDGSTQQTATENIFELLSLTNWALGFNTQPQALSYRIIDGEGSGLGLTPTRLGVPGTPNANMSETQTFAFDPGVLFDGLSVVPGVHDKSIYDWDHINLTSGNFSRDNARTFEATIEQQITDDLFVELGWFREDFDSYRSSSQTSDMISGVLLIDTNLTMLDGTPNPFAGMPLLGAEKPDYFRTPQTSETFRATAAYDLDFTDNDGWTRWLGRHQIMGLAQRYGWENQQWRHRDTIISRNDWVGAPGVFEGSPARWSMNRFYYVGNSNGVVTRDPGLHMLPGRAPQPSRDWRVSSIGDPWASTLRNVSWEFVDGIESSDPQDVLRVQDPNNPSPYGSGTNIGYPQGDWRNEPITVATALHPFSRTSQRQVDSFAGAIQSFWWEERIVTTLGWRHDTSRVRNSPSQLDYFNEMHPDNVQPGDPRYGLVDPSNMYDLDAGWSTTSGTTGTLGVVVHPLPWLGFHYNKSDNFTPSQYLDLDYYGNELPTPTGETEDYGVSFSFFENRLSARLNWYESNEFARVSGDWNPIAAATRGMESDPAWGLIAFYEYQLEIRDNVDIGDYNILDGDSGRTPSKVKDEVLALTGLPADWLDPMTGNADTATVTSRGMEAEIVYNPVANWNIKFTAGRQEAIQSEVVPRTQQWLFEDSFNGEPGGRLAVWQNARTIPELRSNPYIGDVMWWTNTYATAGPNGEPAGTPAGWNRQSNLPLISYLGNLDAPLKLAAAQEGMLRSQVREWRWSFISNYYFTEGFLKGVGVGGSLRWEDRGAIGFMRAADSDGAIANELDPNQPIWDPSRYYCDFWASYQTRLFDWMRMKVQLNVQNAFDDGGLQAVRANPDGNPSTFRIRDPRAYYLTTTFSF